MKPAFNFKSPNSSISSSSRDQTQPPLRISDVLLAADDDDDEDYGVLDERSLMGEPNEGSRSVNCSLPHRLVARCLLGLRRARVKRIQGEDVKKEKQSKMDEDEKGLCDPTAQAKCSMNGFNGGKSVSATGESRKDTSFNLGVGCYLLYLIAASKNELHKMMEARLQMETLLQNTREELLKKSNLSKLSKPNDMFAYSAIDSPQGPYFENQFLLESSIVSVDDQSLRYETPEKEECLEEGMGMGRLEAELQAELERLQLHLDREGLLKHSEQLRIEVTDEHTACSKSQTMSSGEVIDPQPQDADTNCGVPPDELERRLHELLEARQQEEIRELEAALKCLQHRLYEKEVEVSRWKDTAMLISRHAMEPSRFTSQHDPKIITPQGEDQMCDSLRMRC
ncbi:hypothetical protein GH714_008789 [Hevea brasiliensis]|uniref:Protein POLAR LOCALIZATION DURING ASYMMETRIC DIVISION AND REDISTRIBUTION n=1 Tax=Hevea brasiliensis TaxID=3981 RepID=A0A6A6MGV9_HEVBR|nr:hypothetical protein GH714_008789 [Hevea brasiliensis]